jgi:hypothetical protein
LPARGDGKPVLQTIIAYLRLCLVSRVIGHLDRRGHLSGFRVNQDLTKTFSVTAEKMAGLFDCRLVWPFSLWWCRLHGGPWLRTTNHSATNHSHQNMLSGQIRQTEIGEPSWEWLLRPENKIHHGSREKTAEQQEKNLGFQFHCRPTWLVTHFHEVYVGNSTLPVCG